MQKISQIISLAVVIITISVVGPIHAQNEIKNKVTNFTTLMPIESASVYIQNTTIGTVTNVDGRFVLLVPSEHQNDTLVISSIGYKSYKIKIDEFDETEEIYLEEISIVKTQV